MNIFFQVQPGDGEDDDDGSKDMTWEEEEADLSMEVLKTVRIARGHDSLCAR